MDHNKTLAWIGGVFFSGHFTWLDGSYVDFLHWSAGQPDHHEWGDCVGLGLDRVKPGTWDDVDCADYPGEDCICMKERNV